MLLGKDSHSSIKIEDEGENPVASRDIVAAKYYLLDNWAYMTHLN